jgi:hypothetical protein
VTPGADRVDQDGVVVAGEQVEQGHPVDRRLLDVDSIVK